MNIFKRIVVAFTHEPKPDEERLAWDMKHAELDAREARAIRHHKKRSHIQEERRQFVRSGLEAVSNKRVREILGAER